MFATMRYTNPQFTLFTLLISQTPELAADATVSLVLVCSEAI